jgi:hypothetical protein
MKTTIAILSLVLLAASTAGAIAAESWGLPEEEETRFEAKVVDTLCELTGDCPDKCGGGTRQLSLLTDAGELILPIKNVVAFAGTTVELAEFCGKRVTADGLFSTNRGVKMFALQFVREAPDGKWRRANRFINRWAEANGVDPKSETSQQWFRNDPIVKTIIERDGKLGTGK